MKKVLPVLLMFLFAFLSVNQAHAAAPKLQPPQIPLKDLEQKVSAPFGSATAQNPIRWVLYERTGTGAANDPFKSNPVEIVVPNLPAWNPAVTGETYEKATQRKAETIAAAVNLKLGAGRATATTYVFTDAFGRKYNLGQVNITNVHRQVMKNEPTRQNGNGGQFKQGNNPVNPNTPSYPYGGSMKSTGSGMSTGKDPYGAPSQISLGFMNKYVATVFPLAGIPGEVILQQLKAQLDQNGLPTTYDPLLKKLEFDDGFNDADQFVFASSDTGANFEWDYGVHLAPEPISSSLFVLGLLAFARPFIRTFKTQ